jgi:hypothetical protein
MEYAEAAVNNMLPAGHMWTCKLSMQPIIWEGCKFSVSEENIGVNIHVCVWERESEGGCVSVSEWEGTKCKHSHKKYYNETKTV